MLIGVLVVGCALLAGYASYGSRIPNGDVHSCGACHGSGYSLNSFGFDFQVEGDRWSYALSQMDSDGGGADNGEELLDPDGEWSQGDPDPGDPR